MTVTTDRGPITGGLWRHGHPETSWCGLGPPEEATVIDYTLRQGPADTWTIPTGDGDEAVVAWLPHPDWPSQYRLAYIVEGHPDGETQYVGGIAESIVVECDPDAPEGARASWWVGTRPGRPARYGPARVRRGA